MKTLKTKKLDNSFVKSENPLVRFKIIFDKKGAVSYPLYIAADHSSILRMIKSCKEAIKQDSNYSQLVYNETIYKLNSGSGASELLESIVKYICCYYPLEKIVTENLQDYVHISAHIHEENEESDIELVTSFKPPFLNKTFKKVGNSEFFMTLESSLIFLSDEQYFLLYLITRAIDGTGECPIDYNFEGFAFHLMTETLLKPETITIDNSLDYLESQGYLKIKRNVLYDDDVRVDFQITPCHQKNLVKCYQSIGMIEK
jgi:hypothetical protein